MHAELLAHAEVRLAVLAVLEATRVTGVARNVLEYARLARAGVGGVKAGFTLALIRRGERSGARDPLMEAAAGFPVKALAERHRYDCRVIQELQALVGRCRPDIIETHHTKSHCLLALSGLWRTHTWIAFHHGYTQTDLKVRVYNHVDRWSLPHAAHVVTTSEPFAAVLARRGVSPRRITVLHNGVREMRAEPGAVHLHRRALGVADDERVVLAVGRLSREKGQEYLIEAAARWGEAARLVIVGDGPDRERLERLARVRPIARPVIFAGATANVAPFYGMADVFALPSLSEGSPNVLLEAMSCGLPIVATAVGGIPEIATDSVTALLGPPRDPSYLARGVVTLLGDPKRAAGMGTRARDLALSRHTPEQRATTLSRLYAAALRNATT